MPNNNPMNFRTIIAHRINNIRKGRHRATRSGGQTIIRSLTYDEHLQRLKILIKKTFKIVFVYVVLYICAVVRALFFDTIYSLRQQRRGALRCYILTILKKARQIMTVQHIRSWHYFMSRIFFCSMPS